MIIPIEKISKKLFLALRRGIDIIRLFPGRLLQLLQHFYEGITFQTSRSTYWKEEAKNSSRGSVVFLWISEFLLRLIACLGVGEIYETVMDIGKSQSRSLTPRESDLAREIFGDSIDYEVVRIDETAWMGPKQFRFCYVSFNLINSWNPMSDHILIHELVHVWQYQKMGIIYMVRAWVAQHSKSGYNYGGIHSIKKKIATGKTLFDYNLEQQADIVTDYFLLKNNYSPQWGTANRNDLATYAFFISVIKNNDGPDNPPIRV